MARLVDTANIPGHWRDGSDCCIENDAHGHPLPAANVRQCADFDEHWKLEQASFEALLPEHVYSTPVADSAAYYYIVSDRAR